MNYITSQLPLSYFQNELSTSCIHSTQKNQIVEIAQEAIPLPQLEVPQNNRVRKLVNWGKAIGAVTIAWPLTLISSLVYEGKMNYATFASLDMIEQVVGQISKQSEITNALAIESVLFTSALATDLLVPHFGISSNFFCTIAACKVGLVLLGGVTNRLILAKPEEDDKADEESNEKGRIIWRNAIPIALLGWTLTLGSVIHFEGKMNLVTLALLDMPEQVGKQALKKDKFWKGGLLNSFFVISALGVDNFIVKSGLGATEASIKALASSFVFGGVDKYIMCKRGSELPTETTGLLQKKVKKQKEVKWELAIPISMAAWAGTMGLIVLNKGKINYISLASQLISEQIIKQVAKKDKFSRAILMNACLLTAGFLVDYFGQSTDYPCTEAAGKILVLSLASGAVAQSILYKPKQKEVNTL